MLNALRETQDRNGAELTQSGIAHITTLIEGSRRPRQRLDRWAQLGSNQRPLACKAVLAGAQRGQTPWSS